MKIERTVIVLDAADLASVSSFWAGVLGGTVETDDDLASGGGFPVYADPAGHPFCLCWG
jgi:hypothetical protein